MPLFLASLWQGRQDSNLRHPVLETGALPTELLPYSSRTILTHDNDPGQQWLTIADGKSVKN